MSCGPGSRIASSSWGHKGTDDKGLVVASVSKDMQKTYSAGKIIKNLTAHYGGKGGGGPNTAQGGIPGVRSGNPSKMLYNLSAISMMT